MHRLSNHFVFSLTAVALALIVSAEARAADWPQFLGPNRTGISSETGLIISWPAGGPKEVWRIQVASSGLAIQGGRLVTMTRKDGKQFVVSLDPKTGKQNWETEISPAPKQGPWATPTIEDNSAYTFSADGILLSVNLPDGKVNWKHDVPKEYECKAAQYGAACSPLLAGDLVVVNSGPVFAFNRKSGKLAWKVGSDIAGHSSPALLKLGGRDQIVSFNGDAVLGIGPKSGKLLWRHPFKTKWECNIITPVAYKGQVWVSSPGERGGALLDLSAKGDSFETKEVWASPNPKSVMSNYWYTPILVGDHLYGIDSVNWSKIAHLRCIELASGKLVWEQQRYGEANMIVADGKFWITTMKGELVMAKLTPKGYEELGRKKLAAEKGRYAPVISNGLLYLADGKEVVCLDVKGK